MGRALLILAALCAVIGCARQQGTHGGVRHSDLTCAACHGTTMEITPANARVADAACTASGCHADSGPADVQLSRVSFRHRRHGGTGPIQATCAGCHTHPPDVQDKAMVSSGEACSLCHAEQLAGRNSSDCRACHKEPDHVPVSSQGVGIPHSSLNTAETGCLRCHYDVSAPRITVAMATCASCHPSGAKARLGVGEDLHPRHAGVACTACHASTSHRVVSMSSAVVLDCRDCHVAAHEVQLARPGNPSATCSTCHPRTHQAQQRLVLGELPGMPAQPSMKFAAGLVCRSCHSAPGSGIGARPTKGQPAACVGCHRPEYAQIVRWWMAGSRARSDVVERYVRGAAADLGTTAPDTAVRLLAVARQDLAIVRAAGGQHNLELSHAVFRESVSRARAAYALSGRVAPLPPALGPTPRVGMCSYCHYSTDEMWDFKRMPADFHRQVMDTARISASEARAR